MTTTSTTITLPPHLKDQLARGHPWVYRNHLERDLRLPSGAWVRLRCGNWQGYALWAADGPIALRVYSIRQQPDSGWVRRMVQQAWDLRAPLRAAGHTAYRWLFGEGDGLPGLTVDRYGAYAIIQPYMPGAGQLVGWLAEALRACDSGLRGIVLRPRADEDDESADAAAASGPKALKLLYGELPPRDLVVREHGLSFRADLYAGQKTGLFLDQRENRRFVEGLSAGRSVLNCFAYTGSFSLYALRGGATYVTSADIGKGLAAAAADNIELSRLDRERHEFVTADCFELLGHYAEQRRRFDLIVLDPPSFAKSSRQRYAALRAYTRLNTQALRCVAPGGLLVSASCTSQVGPEEFRAMLGDAASSAGVRLQIIHEAGQPLDHPVPAQFPEGRYLKFVVGRVSGIP